MDHTGETFLPDASDFVEESAADVTMKERRRLSSGLKLTTDVAAGSHLIPTFVADQTPTPTRFVRSCEAAGLFDMLSESANNSLDSSSRQASDSLEVNLPSSATTLDSTTSQASKRPHEFVKGNRTLDSLRSPGTLLPSVVCESLGEDSRGLAVNHRPIASDIQSLVSTSYAVHVTNAQEAQSSLYVEDSNTVTVKDASADPMASIKTPTQLSEKSSSESASSNFIQVFVKLANGTLSPVNIPQDVFKNLQLPNSGTSSTSTSLASVTLAKSLISQNSSTSRPTQQQMSLDTKNITQIATSIPVLRVAPVMQAAASNNLLHLDRENVSKGIKQDTKARLVAQLSHGHPRSMMTGSTRATTSRSESSLDHEEDPVIAAKVPRIISTHAAEEMEVQQFSVGSQAATYLQLSDDDLMNTNTLQASPELSETDEEESKRKRSLECNRAAATRCRNKKKQWLRSLESKAHDLQSVNKQLLTETAAMKKEIARLKEILNEHKDCPNQFPKYIP